MFAPLELGVWRVGEGVVLLLTGVLLFRLAANMFAKLALLLRPLPLCTFATSLALILGVSDFGTSTFASGSTSSFLGSFSDSSLLTLDLNANLGAFGAGLVVVLAVILGDALGTCFAACLDPILGAVFGVVLGAVLGTVCAILADFAVFFTVFVVVWVLDVVVDGSGVIDDFFVGDVNRWRRRCSTAFSAGTTAFSW